MIFCDKRIEAIRVAVCVTQKTHSIKFVEQLDYGHTPHVEGYDRWGLSNIWKTRKDYCTGCVLTFMLVRYGDTSSRRTGQSCAALDWSSRASQSRMLFHRYLAWTHTWHRHLDEVAYRHGRVLHHDWFTVIWAMLQLSVYGNTSFDKHPYGEVSGLFGHDNRNPEHLRSSTFTWTESEILWHASINKQYIPKVLEPRLSLHTLLYSTQEFMNIVIFILWGSCTPPEQAFTLLRLQVWF